MSFLKSSGGLGATLKDATKHPLILAGGVIGVSVAALWAMRRGSTQPLDTGATAAVDPNANTAGASDVLPGQAPPATDLSYLNGLGGDPYSGSTYPSIDPTTGLPYGYTPPTTTPDPYLPPIPAPGPVAPPVVVPPVNGQGCPLPKPTIPTALIGRARYVCKRGAWVLESTKVKPGPVPVPGPKPIAPNVGRGRHTTYAGHKNARSVLVLSDGRAMTLKASAHWTLGAAENGDTAPNKRRGKVRVRLIHAAPGTGLAGRYLKV